MSPPQAPLNISAHTAFRPFFQPYDAAVVEHHRALTQLYQSCGESMNTWILSHVVKMSGFQKCLNPRVSLDPHILII